jgi:hypothetical protein
MYRCSKVVVHCDVIGESLKGDAIRQDARNRFFSYWERANRFSCLAVGAGGRRCTDDLLVTNQVSTVDGAYRLIISADCDLDWDPQRAVNRRALAAARAALDGVSGALFDGEVGVRVTHRLHTRSWENRETGQKWSR